MPISHYHNIVCMTVFSLSCQPPLSPPSAMCLSHTHNITVYIRFDPTWAYGFSSSKLLQFDLLCIGKNRKESCDKSIASTSHEMLGIVSNKRIIKKIG